MTELKARVEHALKHEIAPALLLDGNGIEVLDVADGVASVRLTGDKQVRALNAKWRGKDKATNVLSFRSGAAYKPTVEWLVKTIQERIDAARRSKPG